MMVRCCRWFWLELSLSIYCWRSGTAGVASRSASSPTLTRSVMAERRVFVLCAVAFVAAVLGLLFGAFLHVVL